jgi:hypothetical protein
MMAVMLRARRERARGEFERFVAGSVEDLLRTGYLIVWDLGEAEDLVQEALLRVARRWPRVRAMQQPVEAGATAVTLGLSDGTNVQATVADGSFIAWWPGSANATSAAVTGSAGTTTQQLSFAPASPGSRGSRAAGSFSQHTREQVRVNRAHGH